jgi:hypothetical protein
MWINLGQLSPYTSGADSRDKRGICHNLEYRSFSGSPFFPTRTQNTGWTEAGPASNVRSTSSGAASEVFAKAATSSRRLTARTCVADHFDSFIHMTFPISHADWAGESPQKSFGCLKNTISLGLTSAATVWGQRFSFRLRSCQVPPIAFSIRWLSRIGQQLRRAARDDEALP